MTAPRPRRPAKRSSISPARRGLLAKVHMAAKDLKLSDDSYRDLLERETGKRSAADCSDAQLEAVLKAFRVLGWKPKKPRRKKEAAPAVRPVLAKIRALWRALYLLGELRHPTSDRALAAFVRRQTGIEALEWLTPADAYKAIEALKAWCARAGFKVPAGGLDAKQALLHALWAKLGALNALTVPHEFGLNGWVSRAVSSHDTTVAQLDAAQCDKAAEKLGRWVRGVKRDRSG